MPATSADEAADGELNDSIVNQARVYFEHLSAGRIQEAHEAHDTLMNLMDELVRRGN